MRKQAGSATTLPKRKSSTPCLLYTSKGIGVITVAGFLAEVGDVRRFESPRQIQKLAGLSLRENSSGKHKGQTSISKRGRSKLRAVPVSYTHLVHPWSKGQTVRQTQKSKFIKENIDEIIFMFALFKCRKSDKGRN